MSIWISYCVVMLYAKILRDFGVIKTSSSNKEGGSIQNERKFAFNSFAVCKACREISKASESFVLDGPKSNFCVSWRCK